MSYDATAWVPDDDPERDWGVAFQLASDWVEDRLVDAGGQAVLVTNAKNDLGVSELEAFERRHVRTTRRASGIARGTGPVLSYVPYGEDLEFAMRLAKGSSLAVVETVSFPLHGWASWLGATNLVTNAKTPTLSSAVVDAVDRLRFYGNNGFTDQFGKRMARSILTDLRSSDALDPPALVGAVIAAGVSASGAARLSVLMEKL